jgi:hypothetical protein
MNDLYLIWHAFGAETKAALIGAASTLLTAAVGFGALFFQIRSQGRQSREGVAEIERRRHKASIYEDAVLICRELSDSSIELRTKLRMMMMELQIAARDSAANYIPAARSPKLANLYGHFTDAAFKFIFLVENRRFIDPRILVFRSAMSTILHDTNKLMFSDFVEHVVPILPVEGPDRMLFPYSAPSVQSAATATKLSEAFIDSLGDATAYTDDFLVEMQNSLLGDLFGRNVSHRMPLDPRKKVITLENAADLERWFEMNTEWGKTVERVERETAARFA